MPFQFEVCEDGRHNWTVIKTYIQNTHSITLRNKQQRASFWKHYYYYERLLLQNNHNDTYH